jgi:signal transduction histidine kinase
MNIISNAIDALDNQNTKSSRQITIATELLVSNLVAIKIADNGPGIPEVVKSRILDLFFTTKPVGKGTGLGLSISYKIVVEKHKGQLKCISQPGRGTQFWIIIPLAVHPDKENSLELETGAFELS